ncbi:MAG: BON domain-containing protein [Chitinivibrionales bacterium]|nr:BON domain-containing protein [Chitinivibrionales bacterium]
MRCSMHDALKVACRIQHRPLLTVQMKFALLMAAIMTLSSFASAQQEGISDPEISVAVNNALRRDQAVSAHLIDVTTLDGIVTLKGEVGNILEKDRAVGVTHAVKGVRSVVNQIDVLPVMRSANKIRADVVSALWADPVTEPYDIDVSVDPGQASVELRGEVQSFAEKEIATNVVKGVKGVRSVENNLRVATAGKGRPDIEIKTEIERLLHNDPYINHTNIEVEVTGGKVKLSGRVGSSAEKRAAFRKSWVSGVTNIKYKNLAVDWKASENLKNQPQDQALSDEEVKQIVKDALFHDPRTKAFDIEVEVDNNVVTLDGKVSNLKAKRAAQQDARNSIGVKEVNNYLVVRLASPGDKEIQSQVVAAIRRDPIVERHEITPVVRNQKVYLYGKVDSYYEKAHVADIISAVKGVVAVSNMLDVPEVWTSKKDFEIRENIKDEYFWSGYVNEDDVKVSVKEGLAILEGEVNSWTEYHAAVNNAFNGGARAVQSKLQLAGAKDADLGTTFFYDTYSFHPGERVF